MTKNERRKYDAERLAEMERDLGTRLAHPRNRVQVRLQCDAIDEDTDNRFRNWWRDRIAGRGRGWK